MKIDTDPRICFMSSVLINQEALREQYPREYVVNSIAAPTTLAIGLPMTIMITPFVRP
ncbi:MAG TPA: hypothetical protein VGW09_11000 [Nitrososphaeraceae archaeon]|nr:hypothetical protein [Nitrososphaeraceae archaeon]